MIRQTTMFNSVYLNKLKMEFHIPYCYLKIKFLRLWKFSFTMKNSTYHFNFKHKNHHRVPYCSYLLIRALKQKWTSEVAQSCPTLCNPMGCSLPGSSIHGIFQARILEWVAIFFSKRESFGGRQSQAWSPAQSSLVLLSFLDSEVGMPFPSPWGLGED